MTLAELKGFLRACTRKKTEDQIGLVVGVATGAQGDEKSIKKAISKMEKARNELRAKPAETLPEKNVSKTVT